MSNSPVHIMRWAPADYENDPFVMLMKKQDQTRVLTFYDSFLNRSHMAGGFLPADPELLSAALQLSLRTTKAGLLACLAHAKLQLCDALGVALPLPCPPLDPTLASPCDALAVALVFPSGAQLCHKRVVAGIEKERQFRELQALHGRGGGRPKKATLLDTKSPPSPLPAPVPTPVPERIAAAVAPAAPTPPAEPAFPSQRAADVYRRHYPDGQVPGAMFKALRPLVLRRGWEAVEPELDAYLSQTETAFQSWPKFAAGFGTWARGRPPNGNGAGNGARHGPTPVKAAFTAGEPYTGETYSPERVEQERIRILGERAK